MDKHARSRLVAVMTLSLVPARAFAADAVSLSEAVETAARLDPVLTALSARREAANDRRLSTLAPAEPNLIVTKDFDGAVEFGAAQALGFPGKARAAAKVVDAEAGGIEAQAARRRAELATRVKKSYASLWTARKKREVVALKRASWQDILKAAKRRAVKDTTTEVEYLNSQVVAAQIEDDDTSLSAEERSRLAELDLLLGRRADEPLELREPAVPAYPPKLDRAALASAAARSGPSLAEARSDEEIARRRLAVAHSAYLPDFQFSAQRSERAQTKLDAAVTFPVWSWFAERRAARAARGELAARGSDRSEAERALALDIERRVAGLEAMGSKLQNHSERLLPLSERSFKVALANYGYGKVDYNALSAAASGWFGAQDGYYTLLEGYAASWAELEALIGGPLP